MRPYPPHRTTLPYAGTTALYVCIRVTQYHRCIEHINSTRISGSQNICIAPFDKMLDHLDRATKASPTHTYIYTHSHTHYIHTHTQTHTHIYTHYIHTQHKHRTKKKIYHLYCRYHSKQVELSLCATISTLILYRFSR